jgi:hypothetical protein
MLYKIIHIKGCVLLKNIIKIISIVIVVSLSMFAFSSCTKEPVVLNFYDMTEQDLFKLNKKEVVLVGYFTLNKPLNRVGYISSQPYRGYTVEQNENSDKLTYYQLVYEKDETIAVSFKTMPDYTTKPVKITGVLDAGPFTDNNSFIYNFRIKNAVIEEVDIQQLSPELQTFYNLAELGFTDVVYSNLLNLDVFVENTSKNKTFPSFEEYSEIKEYFANKQTNYIEKNFVNLLDRVNSVYTEYSKTYGTDNYDEEKIKEDINKLYEAFDSFLLSYSYLGDNSDTSISTTSQN